MSIFPSEQLLLTDCIWPRQKKDREKGISQQLISSLCRTTHKTPTTTIPKQTIPMLQLLQTCVNHYNRHKNHIHNKISIAIFHTKDSSNLLDHRLVSMLQAQTRITRAVTANLVLTQVLWIIDIQATVIPETYFIYQLESISMHTS